MICNMFVSKKNNQNLIKDIPSSTYGKFKLANEPINCCTTTFLLLLYLSFASQKYSSIVSLLQR